jgi:hypothetical protein
MDTGTTAQDAYRLMLRRYIAPALRELGFRRGPSRNAFRYETPTHAAEVRFIKSMGSTRQMVNFWVTLQATYIKTEWVYWHNTLTGLNLPGERNRRSWTLDADGPVEPAANSVLGLFRSYGWPAIQAALDNPGYPPDRSVRWARTFPKGLRGMRFAEEEEAHRQRHDAVRQEERRADSDPGAFQALLTWLETEPDPRIRSQIAWHLLRRADDERSRQALTSAAAEDENVQVRWIARYALRLADNETPVALKE